VFEGLDRKTGAAKGAAMCIDLNLWLALPAAPAGLSLRHLACQGDVRPGFRRWPGQDDGSGPIRGARRPESSILEPFAHAANAEHVANPSPKDFAYCRPKMRDIALAYHV
jgi:hypothetical protein